MLNYDCIVPYISIYHGYKSVWFHISNPYRFFDWFQLVKNLIRSWIID